MTCNHLAVTTPAAAFAADMPVRRLRFVLAFEHLALLIPARTKRSAWSRIAPIDVVRLAVLARLTDNGFTTAQAGKIVNHTVDRLLTGVATCGIEIPGELIVCSTLLGFNLRAERTPLGITASLQPAEAIRGRALTLDLSQIAAETFARLSKSAGRSVAAPVRGTHSDLETTRSYAREARLVGPSTHEDFTT